MSTASITGFLGQGHHQDAESAKSTQGLGGRTVEVLEAGAPGTVQPAFFNEKLRPLVEALERSNEDKGLDAPRVVVLQADDDLSTDPYMQHNLLSLAKRCHVTFVQVRNKADVKAALSTDVGRTADVVVLRGHGNPNGMAWGKEDWKIDNLEPKDLGETPSTATVVLLSCQAGGGFAEALARQDRRVVVASTEDLDVGGHFVTQTETGGWTIALATDEGGKGIYVFDGDGHRTPAENIAPSAKRAYEKTGIKFFAERIRSGKAEVTDYLEVARGILTGSIDGEHLDPHLTPVEQAADCLKKAMASDGHPGEIAEAAFMLGDLYKTRRIPPGEGETALDAALRCYEAAFLKATEDRVVSHYADTFRRLREDGHPAAALAFAKYNAKQAPEGKEGEEYRAAAQRQYARAVALLRASDTKAKREAPKAFACAALEIGQLYQSGKIPPDDGMSAETCAMVYYTQAIMAAPQDELAEEYAQPLLRLIEEGSALAAHTLANCIKIREPASEKETQNWLAKAVELAEASESVEPWLLHELGQACETGCIEGGVDLAKAGRLYRRAVDLGFEEAAPALERVSFTDVSL